MPDSGMVDEGLERVVLGCVMVDPLALSDIRDVLRPDHFGDETHARVYRAMCELADQGHPVDEKTVSRALASNDGQVVGVQSMLLDLITEVPSAASARWYAQRLADDALRRGVHRLGLQIMAAAKQSDGGDMALHRAHQLLQALAEQSAHLDQSQEWSDVLVELVEEVRSPGTAAGAGVVASGLRDLDAVTGGFRPGTVSLLAARTSVGKSICAAQFAARAAADGHRTVLFTLEMHRRDVARRMLSGATGLSPSAVRDGRLDHEELRALAMAAERLGKRPLHVIDRPRLTTGHMRAILSRITARHGAVGFVVVDYLQLLTAGTDTRRDTRQQEVADVSSGLHAVARDFGVPVLALSQLNREVEREGRRPRLSDLRESGALEQDADVVMALHRDRDAQQELKREASLAVLKNRHGATRTVPLMFDESGMRFGQML